MRNSSLAPFPTSRSFPDVSDIFPLPFRIPGYGLPYSGNGNSILWLLQALDGGECWRWGVVAGGGDGNEFARLNIIFQKKKIGV
ncbi:unnamed protein product [Tuber melanosporum]|uniref:(Perigord truffle) hypothetical protein n=1 Tax=Tuber melanosporum (strain Mel28) TaxID=656061 RepID=D5G4F5_TUBMM|nr:uncharacterized protein GSTUM_00004086001 [Tuber melanosporum]CAZ79398.1 unnamed protein product [Tuber melanosporum]